MGQTVATVLKLMKPYLNKGYRVFTDNYNSIFLTEFLFTQATKNTGTLGKDRKRNPEPVKKAKLKGEVIWRSKNDVIVCKWKDKREVLIKSSAHVPQMVKVTNHHGKEKGKPNNV